MTVLENLMLGRHVHMRHSVLASLRSTSGRPSARRSSSGSWSRRSSTCWRSRRSATRTVGALAYGFQKRVELGRALCMQPALLLLDEPMAGMNAEEKEDMARFILDVNELAGVTMVLIEHDMGVVMDISDRVIVLDFGR